MTLVISGMQEEALRGDLFGKSAPVPESLWRKERSQKKKSMERSEVVSLDLFLV